MPIALTDISGGTVGFLLTVMVLSYVLGDNPVYRIAIHTFVGVTAGYVVGVVCWNVFYPQVLSVEPLLQQSDWTALALLGFGWLLAALLLLKLNPNSQLGRFPLAFLVGVGTAVAVGGALTGTLIPQADAATIPLTPAGSEDLLEQFANAVILLIGTLATLLFFWYGGRARPGGQVDRPFLIKPIALAGKVFLGITFGVMYAGALAASLAFLAERLTTIQEVVQKLFQ